MVNIIGWALGVLSVFSVGMYFEKGEFLSGFICVFAVGFTIPPMLNKINNTNKQKAEEKGKQYNDITQKSGNIAGVIIFIVAAIIGGDASSTSVEVTKTITYKVVGERDFSFNGRKRVGVYVFAPDATTKEERAAVVKQAALDLQSKTNADFADAILEVADFAYGTGNVLAMADYAPDGCGTSGKDCNGNKWSILASDAQVPALQIKVLKQWEALKSSYQGSKGYLDLEDEAKLSNIIAQKLNIKIKDVRLPMVAGSAESFTDELDGSIKVTKSN